MRTILKGLGLGNWDDPNGKVEDPRGIYPQFYTVQDYMVMNLHCLRRKKSLLVRI